MATETFEMTQAKAYVIVQALMRDRKELEAESKRRPFLKEVNDRIIANGDAVMAELDPIAYPDTYRRQNEGR